jgi:hypothetical protein
VTLAKSIFLLIPIAFVWNGLYAGNSGQVKQFINHKDWNFVENKGQLTTSEIKYYGHQVENSVKLTTTHRSKLTT